ncbi:NAD(P)H-dependent oxidoreductase subunit E [bacterium]|nr:NAD(P)H-dependent oxidoreductase subunit E [bacterium]
MELEPEELSKIKKIIGEYKEERGALVPILHEVNTEYKYLPENVLRYISEELDLSLSLIYQIATFYDAFSLTQKGLYTVSVCIGTACYIKGGDKLLAAFERELGIKAGETTKDQKFSLKTVSCLGCCGQAPVLTVNEELYGHMTQARVKKVLGEYG